MIDPRPSIPEEIDLTELGIFSGYKNQFSSHRMHIKLHDIDPSALGRIENFEVIGFSSCVTKDYPRKNSSDGSPNAYGKLNKMQRANDFAMSDVCEVCSTPHTLPILIRALYPRVFKFKDEMMYLDCFQNRCMKDGTIATVDMNATNVYAVFGKTYNKHVVYDLINKMIENYEYFDSSQLYNHHDLSQTLMSRYRGMCANDHYYNSRTIRRLNQVVEAMADVWVPNIRGLQHSFGLIQNVNNELNEIIENPGLVKNYPFVDYRDHNSDVADVIVIGLARALDMELALFNNATVGSYLYYTTNYELLNTSTTTINIVTSNNITNTQNISWNNITWTSSYLDDDNSGQVWYTWSNT